MGQLGSALDKNSELSRPIQRTRRRCEIRSVKDLRRSRFLLVQSLNLTGQGGIELVGLSHRTLLFRSRSNDAGAERVR